MNKQMIWPEGERRTVLALDAKRTGAADAVDLGRLLRAVRRQAWVVGLCATAGLAISIASLATTEPLFTANSAILLDVERAELLDLVSELPSAIVGDSSVQSEIEILKSRELALHVIDRLDLINDPVPLSTPPSIIEQGVEAVKGGVRAALALIEPAEDLAGAGAAEEVDPRLALSVTLRNNLLVERIGRSYVFQLSYTAPSPALAAEITNAYAAAYLAYQLEANSSGAEAAANWLRGRVETLRVASLQATRELDRFRRDNNLVSVGERLLSEQQASELMSQLILAEADASRAQALARQAETAVAGGADGAARSFTVSDGDGVTATLLEDYTVAERQRRRVEAEFGADHPEAQRIVGEIERLEDLIFNALERRLTAARNTAEAAQSRVVALRNGLQDALAATGTDEEITSQLAQLEQIDQSYSQIYRDYLTRLEQAVQRQSVPIVPVRVISGADVPEGQSSPARAQVLAIGLFLGLFAGAGIGTLREMRRDRLDGPDDVERLVGVRSIATLPRMPRWRPIGGRGAAKAWRRKARPLPSREVDAAVNKALRAVKLALDDMPGRRAGRTVGITSARAGEGRTTVAILLGTMLARNGFSTAVVDASDGALARTFGPTPTVDIVSLARDGRAHELADLPRTGVEPLTILRLSPEADPSEGILLAGTRTMAQVFDALGETFDYVVIDLPPFTEGRDATALSRHLDTIVIVNRPGTGRATEVSSLAADMSIPPVSGVLLNQR